MPKRPHSTSPSPSPSPPPPPSQAQAQAQQPRRGRAFKKPKSARARLPALDDHSAHDASQIYYTSNNLQKVRPYHFTYQTYAKGRWVGRTILDIFATEFRDRPQAYYEGAIRTGTIKINGTAAAPTQILKDGDLITHAIHRHEPPVTTTPLRIVAHVNGLLAVDKPGSMPVHPSGRYNYNSVIKQLTTKHGYTQVFPVNRLDRLTSGLMLVALDTTTARTTERAMAARKIKKEYLCRVQGEFPAAPVVCDKPIRVVAHKLSLNCVDESPLAKQAKTEFWRIWTDSTHSIVYCRPHTGRTHQIRVHLQFLGFPVANDPLYCNRDVWGDALGKDARIPGGGSWKSLVDRMSKWKRDHEDAVRGTQSGDLPTCPECEIPLLPDPTPDQMCIWLHAWRYSGPGWSYETEWPEWAQEARGFDFARIEAAAQEEAPRDSNRRADPASSNQGSTA